MSCSYPEKELYTIDDLLAIMRLLRAPDGCPWDREQTHDSIRTNFLEEAYEAVEALDNGDVNGLREELGDVLLQIVFHTQMEEEVGSFTFADVTDELCRKLLTRHPHVFGDVQANDSAQALASWDASKRKAKKTDAQSDLLRNVPKTLPALMRAEKVQSRARRVGFDWPEIGGALAALHSEVDELEQAIAQGNAGACEDELGDVLFSAVNVSRFLGADAERALGRSVEKFVRRFTAVESLAHARGVDMQAATLEELDALWDEVKTAE